MAPAPDDELRPARVGARSTVYAGRDGGLYRRYHDTGAWTVMPYTVDAAGAARGAGNRRVDAVVTDAFAEGDATTYRAASAASRAARRAQPAHLRRARDCLLLDACADVRTLARRCDVEVSTAWCYAARVVEEWPAATHAAARRLVHPPLLAALEALPDASGPLRALMPRLLPGDPDWRCVDDRYAHVRLARLCVEAAARDGEAATA